MEITLSHQLAENARQALLKLKNEERVVLEQNTQHLNHISSLKKDVKFEEFDADNFKTRIKLDSYILEQLLHRIETNDDAKKIINSQLGKIYNLNRSIFETVNLKIDPMLKLPLKASEHDLNNKAKELINVHFENMYYKHTPNQRKELYFDRIKDILVENMTQNSFNENNIEDNIEQVYKFIIIENLLNKIMFPGNSMHKIQHIIKNKDYVDYFDYDSVNEMIHESKSEIKKLANMISLFI